MYTFGEAIVFAKERSVCIDGETNISNHMPLHKKKMDKKDATAYYGEKISSYWQAKEKKNQIRSNEEKLVIKQILFIQNFLKKRNSGNVA